MICVQPDAVPAAPPPEAGPPAVPLPPAPAPGPPVAPVGFAAVPEAVGPLWPPGPAWGGEAASAAGPASAPPPAARPLLPALSPAPVDVRAVRVTVVQLVVRAIRSSDNATTTDTGFRPARWRRPLVWLCCPPSRPGMFVNGLSPARELVAALHLVVSGPGTRPPRPPHRSVFRRCLVPRTARR